MRIIGVLILVIFIITYFFGFELLANFALWIGVALFKLILFLIVILLVILIPFMIYMFFGDRKKKKKAYELLKIGEVSHVSRALIGKVSQEETLQLGNLCIKHTDRLITQSNSKSLSVNSEREVYEIINIGYDAYCEIENHGGLTEICSFIKNNLSLFSNRKEDLIKIRINIFIFERNFISLGNELFEELRKIDNKLYFRVFKILYKESSEEELNTSVNCCIDNIKNLDNVEEKLELISKMESWNLNSFENGINRLHKIRREVGRQILTSRNKQYPILKPTKTEHDFNSDYSKVKIILNKRVDFRMKITIDLLDEKNFYYQSNSFNIESGKHFIQFLSKGLNYPHSNIREYGEITLEKGYTYIWEFAG